MRGGRLHWLLLLSLRPRGFLSALRHHLIRIPACRGAAVHPLAGRHSRILAVAVAASDVFREQVGADVEA